MIHRAIPYTLAPVRLVFRKASQVLPLYEVAYD